MNLFSGLTQKNPINNNNNDLFSSLTGNSNTNTINILSQYSPYQINIDQFGKALQKKIHIISILIFLLLKLFMK
jgi:hypothetical protein